MGRTIDRVPLGVKRWIKHAGAATPTGLLLLCLVPLILTGCDNGQSLSLTTEDYRFTPDLLHASTASPILLTILNAGREVHEFDSPLLQYAVERPIRSPSNHAGLTIVPGDRLRLIVAPPAGTYLYICRRKGHANMTGTLIVE